MENGGLEDDLLVSFQGETKIFAAEKPWLTEDVFSFWGGGMAYFQRLYLLVSGSVYIYNQITHTFIKMGI